MRLSDAEWEVMAVMWCAGRATAREVREQLAGRTGWAYTTVKTMLERLVEKGALGARRAGRSVVYEPAVSREEARRSAVRSLLDRAFGGTSAPLLRFLVNDRKLSAREREELLRILEEEEGR